MQAFPPFFQCKQRDYPGLWKLGSNFFKTCKQIVRIFSCFFPLRTSIGMQFACWIDCRNLQGYVGGNKPELEVVIVLPNHHKTALITIMPSFLIIIMTVDWICLELLLMKHNTYRTQSRFYGNIHRSGPIPKCYIQSPYLSWADTHVSPAYWSLGPTHERNGYYQKTLLTFSWRQITRGFGVRPFKVSPSMKI